MVNIIKLKKQLVNWTNVLSIWLKFWVSLKSFFVPHTNLINVPRIVADRASNWRQRVVSKNFSFVGVQTSNQFNWNNMNSIKKFLIDVSTNINIQHENDKDGKKKVWMGSQFFLCLSQELIDLMLNVCEKYRRPSLFAVFHFMGYRMAEKYKFREKLKKI